MNGARPFSVIGLIAGLAFAAAPGVCGGEAAPVVIAIDAAQALHPISPLIYGLNYATTVQLEDLGGTLNRSGGDSISLYNWRDNAQNAGRDWYFKSFACTNSIFDQHGDEFVTLTRAAKAEPMLSIPMIGWVAKLDRDRKPLASFAIGKYGLQDDSETAGFADAGNGITIDGIPISDNDPEDAAIPDGPEQEKGWIEHLRAQFGSAGAGGVSYYILDNEPSVWHLAHRDVHPEGAHAQEIADKVKSYASMVKSVDPKALIVAPEEWGWTAFRYSGYDQQWAEKHGWWSTPDRVGVTHDKDYLPWLLSEWRQAGHPVDVVSVHYYPQGGEYSDTGDDVSPKMQLLRNRSTRSLWDPAYTDSSWINAVVALIPTLRNWVDSNYYPGTPIAITEYSWGGEHSMSGATAQADILGIFGREGLDMATRWVTPETGSPTYLAFKLYRNYDDRHSAFGETSVAAAAPNPDDIAAFAALRGSDGAMTVMVVNKQLDQPARMRLTLDHFAGAGQAERFELATGKMVSLPPIPYHDAALEADLPAQSVTLFVFHGQGS